MSEDKIIAHTAEPITKSSDESDDGLNRYTEDFLHFYGSDRQDLDKTEAFNNLLADLRFIRDKYGIRPKMHRPNKSDKKSVDAEKMSFEDAVNAIQIFREEIIKYPPELIKNAGITHFRVVERLWGKFLRDKQEIAGRSYEPGEIYVANRDDSDDYRGTIHHELLHRFDFQRYEFKDKIPFAGWIDGIMDARIDKEWKQLNQHYGVKYEGNNWPQMLFRPEGFATAYGSMNAHEDRATLAELLMTNTRTLFRRCRTDRLLKDKTDTLISLYEKDSNGKMNVKFFNDLAAGSVNENYWK